MQNLTQESLSSMIGTSKSQLWRIENGKVGASIDTLARIADALEVKVRDLIAF